VKGLRTVALVMLMTTITTAGAWGTERQMLLEVMVNGRSTGQIGEFIDRDGALYARPSELRDLGFALGPSADDEPVPLSGLPNMSAQVNEAKQALLVVAKDSALQPTELASQSALRLAPLTASSLGAVLNYDVLGTFSGRQNTGGAMLDGRVFGPYGLFQSTGLANIMPNATQKAFERLDTTYTFSQPDDERRWRVGDVVTGALSWTRAVRAGGFQIASDFSLRPDLITYPLPVISASAAVPSAIDVMVNGIRQYTQTVQPGPFTVHTLPMVNGAGNVAVVAQDALGRQTLLSLPFYASTTLLKPGLASYSLEAGMVRRNYGLATDTYAGFGLNGSVRYGLSNSLTVEGHGEATDNLALLGAGAQLQLGVIGVLNGAVSASRDDDLAFYRTGGAAPSSGASVSFGFQRLSPRFNFTVQGTLASDGYRDLAAVNGTPVLRSTLNASIGRQLGDYGAISLSYIKQTPQPQLVTSWTYALDNGLASPATELATVNYSVPVAKRFSLYATGFKDLRQNNSYGLVLGLSFLLGASTSVSVVASVDDGQASSTLNVARPVLKPGDFGYQVQDTEGAQPHRTVQGEYLGSWIDLTAGVDQAPGLTAGRVGARGALVWAGGGLFASDEIYDSFAVVHTNAVADVPVLYENRLIGVTNARGELLVPYLLSYQNNKLAVDPTSLPPDIEVGRTKILVRPADGAGVVVDFQVKAVRAALLTLQDAGGRPLPIGSVVHVKGEPDRPVGYDGEAYVTGLTAANRLDVVLPDGSHCVATFDYKPVKGQVPEIGPAPCR
jgi:outer membrane usher protein